LSFIDAAYSNFYSQTNFLYLSFISDNLINPLLSIFNQKFLNNNAIINFNTLYYTFIFDNNLSFLSSVNSLNANKINYFNYLSFVKIFIKINIILFILYLVFFVSYLENYLKQIISLNSFTKLFILNETEKEVGPADDFFFFAILFLLTLCSFIIVSLIVILFQSSIFV
jgi:hypothetical protein